MRLLLLLHHVLFNQKDLERASVDIQGETEHSGLCIEGKAPQLYTPPVRNARVGMGACPVA